MTSILRSSFCKSCFHLSKEVFDRDFPIISGRSSKAHEPTRNNASDAVLSQSENSSRAVSVSVVPCVALRAQIHIFTVILLTTVWCINLGNVLPTLSYNGYRNSHKFKLELCKFGDEIEGTQNGIATELFVCSESGIYGNMVISANLC